MNKAKWEIFREMTEKHIKNIEQGRFDALANETVQKYGMSALDYMQKRFDEAGVATNLWEQLYTHNKERRVRQIKCYNVGFGDCFLCKADVSNDCPKMLVDFGGSAKPIKRVAPYVSAELGCASRRYLMLSHLHQDHYNGIKLLSGRIKFDEIYLPNYITRGGLMLLGAVLLHQPSEQLVERAREILSIPKLLNGFVAKHTRVYFLSAGSTISNDLCSFRVLLPARQHHNFEESLPPLEQERLWQFYRDYILILGYEEGRDEVAFATFGRDTLPKEIDALIDGFLKNVNLQENEAEATQRKQQFKDSGGEYDLKKRFKRYHNSMSLAFHQLGVDDAENVLFLGDAEPDDIADLRSVSWLNQRYCFVKVQHHGTKRHFVSDLPQALYFAFSNGGAYSSTAISCLYNCQYGPRTSFICSNKSNCDMAQSDCICYAQKQPYTKCSFPLCHEVNI